MTSYIILSRQLNYSTAPALLQLKFVKGGAAMYIFRAWITTKDGTKIYAKDYGKRAFRIWIGPGSDTAKKY